MMVKLKDLLLLSLIVSVTQTFAADRALLIGVGEYQIKKNNLPGIDLDLAMMQQASQLMGFEEIKVLKNEQATFNNVVNTMNSFLINGVSKDDRVLLYYSGHGAQVKDVNGDELDDGVDELLTMHDMAVGRNQAGRPVISNILVDDELNALLKRIPSDNLLVLVDACHSGTSTRSMRIRHSILGDDVQVKPKFIQFEGMEASRGVSLKTTPSTQLSNDIPFVSLAAAGDLESSIATSKGSLFTLGVLSAVKNAAQTGQVLTPKRLRQQVTAFIKNENQTFTPRLSGNTRLANKALKLKPAKASGGNNWQRFTELSRKGERLKLLVNQNYYRLGDALKFKIYIYNKLKDYKNVKMYDFNDKSKEKLYIQTSLKQELLSHLFIGNFLDVLFLLFQKKQIHILQYEKIIKQYSDILS